VSDDNYLPGFHITRFTATAQGGIGHIQYVDRFGNLITTIPGEQVAQHDWRLSVGSKEVFKAETYSSVATGELLALVGSQGWVEIAVSSGSAHAQLGLQVGDRVELKLGNCGD
jgi:S-adenosyl-L-methionine hydrolase (adenosine-forming)